MPKKKVAKKKVAKKKLAKKKLAKKKLAKKKVARRKKAVLKTQANDASVSAFLAAIPDASKRKDAAAVARLMRKATGAMPKMWGTSIVGYGAWQFVYASGRTGDWFEVGFSPRKQSLTLYVLQSGPDFAPLLSRLGRHETGKGCLHIKRLEEVELAVLEEIIGQAVAARRR